MSDNDTKTFREIFFDAEFRVGQGIASAFDLDQAAFDGAETINGVAASETAMDAVAGSETARDAIRNSATAFEAVGASNMAIGKFAAGGAGLDPADFADMDAVAGSETAMDAVAASATAMDAVAASATAMDAVIASEAAMDAVAASATARDAIRNSATAFEAVGASNIAIGKFAAGGAGLDPSDFADMDAVAGSETAMDAVAASATAMDAVTGSTLATSIALLSPHFDIIFSEQVGSETFFDGRTINPNSGDVEGISYVYSWDGGDANAEIVFSNNTPSEFDGGRSLHIDSETSTDGDTFANSDESHSDYLLDVSDADNFNVWLNDPDGNEFCIFVDGTKVASGLTPSSWEKHTFDVSSETGEIIIGVGSNNDTTGGEWFFTAPHLEN